MLIQVADIPPDGLRIEGTADFPRPFQDLAWALINSPAFLFNR